MRLPRHADPRSLLPSRAHPEHRKTRKELEKEHQIGFTEVGVLSLIGLTLAWNIENQVRKCEEKKEKEEEEQKKREDRGNHRRENGYHDKTADPRRNHRSPESSRSSNRGNRDASESYTRDTRRRQSVDHRADSRRDDRYRSQTRRYDPRDNPRDNHRYGSQSQYHDPRDLDLASRGRSRRDSW